MLKRVNRGNIKPKDATQASAFVNECLGIISKIKPSRVSTFIFFDDLIRHSVYGMRLSDFMLPAISHLESKNEDPVSFEIYSVDGMACDIRLPRPFWSWDDLDPQGYILGLDSEEVVAQYDAYTSTFRILLRARKLAIHWVINMSKLPYWERSFPLRSLINWWFRHSSIQPFHAAAVALENRAVLLTAKGGSGKSTTALHCLLDGMQYLGDDFVLVDCDTKFVHSMYNVVKLTPADLKQFPALNQELQNGVKEDQDKVQVFLNEDFEKQIVAKASIEAILVPRIVHGSLTHLSDITFEEVMAALTTSTLYLLKGSSSEAMKKITRLVNSLPAYYLNLGSDFNASPSVIRKLLKA